ncbi:ATP-dependent DNA helicase [Trichonephila clavipes]|nr:ATP-dependent DNA helicase [Trichonephila clavipes]
MAVRNRPACVAVPFILAANDPENYYYSLLLQYVPYRSKDELLDSFNSSWEELLRKQCNMMEIYKERYRQLEMALNGAHTFELLNRDNGPLHHDDIVEILEKRINEDQFERAKQAMNIGQLDIFVNITSCMQERLNGSQNRFRLFITGNAGTAKTFLFKLLRIQIDQLYSKG